jgi:hypothetical protein
MSFLSCEQYVNSDLKEPNYPEDEVWRTVWFLKGKGMTQDFINKENVEEIHKQSMQYNKLKKHNTNEKYTHQCGIKFFKNLYWPWIINVCMTILFFFMEMGLNISIISFDLLLVFSEKCLLKYLTRFKSMHRTECNLSN